MADRKREKDVYVCVREGEGGAREKEAEGGGEVQVLRPRKAALLLSLHDISVFDST